MRSYPEIYTCQRMEWVLRQAQAALAPWQ